MMSFRVLLASRKTGVLCTVSLALLLQGDSCPNLDTAKEKVRAEIKKVLIQPKNQGRDWRVHWKRLEKGTVVSSFDGALTRDTETYQCLGRCVMFFVDLDPYAHFAHPTRILVYDSKHSNRQLPITVFEPTAWWPTIQREGWDHPRSVFNTVTELEDPQQVFHLDDPEIPNELPVPVQRYGLVAEASFWPIPVASGEEEATKPPPSPTVIPTPPPSGGGGADTLICDTTAVPVWAILVNGYNDLSNTFDEDVAGMYTVLRGFEVLEERTVFLSPIEPPGIQSWVSASKAELGIAFSEIGTQMSTCKGTLDTVPHFLLFWSSHGTDQTLFCNRADGNQDNVTANELNLLLEPLETIWKPDAASDTELEVTIVIEACESGSVGQKLHDLGPHRRILASARGNAAVSYRDIDHDVAGTTDPNPADAGSETIWGYVEAFGAALADVNDDGKVGFDEAVEYAKKTDVTFLSGDHDIGVWAPDATGPVLVHGAWNTSERVSSDVTFFAPSVTNSALTGSPATAKVAAGQLVKIGVEIDTPGANSEKGALALRLFRNDCPESATTAACDKWAARYYGDGDDRRTTVMIPGLAASDTLPLKFEVEMPSSYVEGDTMRLVVTLDSAQKIPTTGGTIEAMPKSEIILEVGEQCTSFCCWWKNLWN